jgi:hypothetical protein
MSKDLISAGDGFGVPENAEGRYIVGRMIKFADGAFIVDKTEALPADIELVALNVITCWVHWQDGEPIDHRVTQLGQRHPDRDELPDQDESLWEPGLDEKPSDPWKDSRYLRLIDPRTGADFTFVSDSYGGRRGVGDLKSQIRNVRMAHPNAVPIVKLRSVPRKTKYGMKQRPAFQVIGWRNRGTDGGETSSEDPRPSPAHARLTQSVAQLDAAQRRAEMDDEIPF